MKFGFVVNRSASRSGVRDGIAGLDDLQHFRDVAHAVGERLVTRTSNARQRSRPDEVLFQSATT